MNTQKWIRFAISILISAYLSGAEANGAGGGGGADRPGREPKAPISLRF